MISLHIDHLQLNIADAAGHEHRVQPIALRAVTLLADRLEERQAAGARTPGVTNMDSLNAPPISLDLSQVSDEQAAEAIAGAWLEALVLKLRV